MTNLKTKIKLWLTYDAKSAYPIPPENAEDLYAEFDSDVTIGYVSSAITRNGYQLTKVGNYTQLMKYLRKYDTSNVLVFNLCECLYGRGREALVPALLDHYNVKYIGSDPVTMCTTLDKVTAKKVVAYHGIKTPDFCEINTMNDSERCALKFPVILKLRCEGTSKGIDTGSVVYTRSALVKRTRELMRRYPGTQMIAEKFLTGMEFTVGVTGNAVPEALPPVQVIIDGKSVLGDKVYTYDMVANPGVDYLCPVKAGPKLLHKLSVMAIDAYKALECRDFGRIDIRTDFEGVPYFLECNPLPSLTENDIWPLAAEAAGMSYDKIIGKIIRLAELRYGL
ncbi:MAG: hypothetical protein WC955_00750 [Elusimicrobiota bacterium]